MKTLNLSSTVKKIRQTTKKKLANAPTPPQPPSPAGNVWAVAGQAVQTLSGAAAGGTGQSGVDAVIASITSVMARDRLINAVKFGHDLWRLQARLKDLKVMAVSAIGSPGCLKGPDLEPLILQYPDIHSLSGYEEDIAEAVAEGVAHNFKQWADKVTVPGLPWYPAFAAFPGPQAPPMPNVPSPLIACVSSKVNKITVASELESAMYSRLPSELKRPEVQSLMQAIATAVALKFLTWLAQQQVMNVLGKGPIPSFAPPYVPVGPVVNGSAEGMPGHLAV